MSEISKTLKIKLLHADARVPARQTVGSAGYDLYSIGDQIILPRDRVLMPTGIAVELPCNTYGRIAPRSSLACRGILIGAGVIDADYRAEIKVLMINISNEPIGISKGDRIAQLILERIVTPPVSISDLTSTERDQGGFGSTGK